MVFFCPYLGIIFGLTPENTDIRCYIESYIYVFNIPIVRKRKFTDEENELVYVSNDLRSCGKIYVNFTLQLYRDKPSLPSTPTRMLRDQSYTTMIQRVQVFARMAKKHAKPF